MKDLSTNQLILSVKKRLISASQDGEIDKVLRLAGLGKELEALAMQENQIEERLQQIKAELENKRVEGSQKTTPIQTSYPVGISPQKRGDNARQQYLEKLAHKGIVLQANGKKKFSTKANLHIGMPYAREQGDAWFLGLAEGHFDIVVLLCETATYQTLDFILPASFVNKIWSALTRSRGQVKFHVQKSGPNFMLRVPGGGFEPLNEHLSKTSALI